MKEIRCEVCGTLLGKCDGRTDGYVCGNIDDGETSCKKIFDLRASIAPKLIGLDGKELEAAQQENFIDEEKIHREYREEFSTRNLGPLLGECNHRWSEQEYGTDNPVRVCTVDGCKKTIEVKSFERR